MYNPDRDGTHHINVYSKGKTELGRMLSNFYASPVIIPGEGQFQSIEGYWYWIGCVHPDKDKLRLASGYNAKALGRLLGAPDWIDTDHFKTKIKLAIMAKIEQNSALKDLMKNSSLPFVHYYVYNDKVVTVPEGWWIVDELERLRSALNETEV